MTILHDIYVRARRAVPLALGALLAVYFSYHLVQGEHGLITYLQLKAQVKTSQAELDALQAEKLRLGRRVRLLRPDSLDLDLVDEQARHMLGFAHPDELVIFTDKRL